MDKKVKVFLEKDGKRKEVEVLKRVERGRERVWFKEMTQQPHQQKPEEKEEEPVIVETDDGSATEDDPATKEQATGMCVDDPEERETEQKMWLAEKVTSLEKENGELKSALQEMETRLANKENTTRQVEERCARLETSIAQIMAQIQRQNAFNEGVRASFTSLAEDVKKHHDNFREVARIFQAHEEYIVKTGAASQEMAHYINALIKENENKTVWISSLVRESHEQTNVLRQHELGLQVQAEVIRRVANQQSQQRGTATGTGPTVSEVDNEHDGDSLDFPGGQNPNSGPPNNRPFGAAKQIIQVPMNMEILQVF